MSVGWLDTLRNVPGEVQRWQASQHHMCWDTKVHRESGTERGREGARERGREGGIEGGRNGGRGGGREGGSQREKEMRGGGGERARE